MDPVGFFLFVIVIFVIGAIELLITNIGTIISTIFLVILIIAAIVLYFYIFIKIWEGKGFLIAIGIIVVGCVALAIWSYNDEVSKTNVQIYKITSDSIYNSHGEGHILYGYPRKSIKAGSYVAEYRFGGKQHIIAYSGSGSPRDLNLRYKLEWHAEKIKTNSYREFMKGNWWPSG